MRRKSIMISTFLLVLFFGLFITWRFVKYPDGFWEQKNRAIYLLKEGRFCESYEIFKNVISKEKEFNSIYAIFYARGLCIPQDIEKAIELNSSVEKDPKVVGRGLYFSGVDIARSNKNKKVPLEEQKIKKLFVASKRMGFIPEGYDVNHLHDLGLIELYQTSTSTNVESFDRSQLVLRELESRISNPKAALYYFYNSSDWNLLIQEFENGSKGYLKLWSRLRSQSDGGATEELNLALSILLKEKPELVFTSIKDQHNNDEYVIYLTREVCKVSGQEVQNIKYSNDKEEKDAALSGLNQRLKELSKLKSMIELKKQCEIEINKNIQFWNSK